MVMVIILVSHLILTTLIHNNTKKQTFTIQSFKCLHMWLSLIMVIILKFFKCIILVDYF